jgi:hypothetical protein
VLPPVARRLLLALLVAAPLALGGCGGSAPTAVPTAAPAQAPTPADLLNRPGANSDLALGTSDYSVGDVRISFLVLRGDNKPLYRPTADVWVARRLEQPVIQHVTAKLEHVGVPGGDGASGPGQPPDVTKIYVAHLRLPGAGQYVVVAQPRGGEAAQALGNLNVGTTSFSPSVGARATPSRTPTLADVGGPLRAGELTTAEPPDLPLLRYSVADSLAAHKPFVLVFATPRLCQSRTCGPVVDVVDAVRRQLATPRVRFIHVEIYNDNDPLQGKNRWVEEWRLPTEPWTFLVRGDGRIAAKLEGAFSVAELRRLVRAKLL